MTPREVRLARAMILDAMILGAEIMRLTIESSGDDPPSTDGFEPSEMISKTGVKLLTALKNKDKKSFAAVMASQYGVLVGPRERSLDAIVRTVRFVKAGEVAREMATMILEEIAEAGTLEDITERWEEALHVLKRATEPHGNAAQEETEEVGQPDTANTEETPR